MDSDAEAVTNFLSVITLPGFYREQPAAYAGLFEALMLQKQDDQVTQWVQNGQAQFAGAGDLQLAFLRDAAKALKRRKPGIGKRKTPERAVWFIARIRRVEARIKAAV